MSHLSGRFAGSLLLASVAFLVVLLPTGSASDDEPIITTLTDQVTVEPDHLTPGHKFQVNTGRSREYVNGRLVSTLEQANISIFDFECNEFGCSSTSWFDCVPSDSPTGDSNLPPGALRFTGLRHATLNADFNCRDNTLDETFTLDVALVWNAPRLTPGYEVQSDPGPPPVTIFTVWAEAFGMPVTGSAVGGGQDHLDPEATGLLVHRAVTVAPHD